MLTRIPFLAPYFQKEIPTLKTILTGVILAGLLVVAGCSQTSVETGSNGAATPATTGHHGGDMGSGGQEHGPGHQDGQ